MTYQKKPDYLLETTAKATYDYDAKGNRTKYVTDNEDLEYSYDAEDRLLSDGKDDFSYDANGNMTGVKSGEDTVEYVYNAANKLTEVKYPDGTYVKYGYDAFGRKVSREEAYWNKEAGDAPGKSEYAPGQNKEKSNNGNGKGNPNGSSNGNANGKAEKKNPLKLKTDTTSYLYDGFTNAVTNEYTGNGSPLSQYYMANDRVVSKKTFGNHGLVIPGREPSLKTNGGLMDYHYDGMRNVTELTDRHGDSIEEYRYDAFGGLYTGITAPYNTYGFAGKSYDPKANLIDNQARWYQAQTGRFTSADPYRGDVLTPYTQNRYAYVGNNPVNRWDPSGYWMDGDENLPDEDYDRIGELTEEWENATTQEDRDRIHNEANDVRNGGSGGSGGTGGSGDDGGSGGSGDDDDDDDDDEGYDRPLRAGDWYNINQTVLSGYGSVPQSEIKVKNSVSINEYSFGSSLLSNGTNWLLTIFDNSLGNKSSKNRMSYSNSVVEDSLRSHIGRNKEPNLTNLLAYSTDQPKFTNLPAYSTDQQPEIVLLSNSMEEGGTSKDSKKDKGTENPSIKAFYEKKLQGLEQEPKVPTGDANNGTGKPKLDIKYNNSLSKAMIAGVFAIEGGLVADDLTIIGVADDVLIPIVAMGGVIIIGGVTIYEAAKERSKNPPAKRDYSSSKKEAHEKAKRAGKGKEPIHGTEGDNGPHYHPDVPMPKDWTPKGPTPHDHYYYPKP